MVARDGIEPQTPALSGRGFAAEPVTQAERRMGWSGAAFISCRYYCAPFQLGPKSLLPSVTRKAIR